MTAPEAQTTTAEVPLFDALIAVFNQYIEPKKRSLTSRVLNTYFKEQIESLKNPANQQYLLGVWNHNDAAPFAYETEQELTDLLAQYNPNNLPDDPAFTSEVRDYLLAVLYKNGLTTDLGYDIEGLADVGKGDCNIC
jgi:hypothetical protein